MVTTFLKSQLARLWYSRRRGNNKGFTLAELLIVTIIAGGIVSGLLYLVVELLTADQRDSSRNETQRDMQRALDYISGELRQAVYVYPGECMGTASSGSVAAGDYCPGLANYLPTNVVSTDSVPILAFWRQKELPPSVKSRCASAPSLTDASVANIPCGIGNSYALVVYSLSKANSSTTPRTWSGKARITRYELPQYQYAAAGGAVTQSIGYGSPLYNNKQIFRSWPFGPNDTAGVPIDTRTPPGGRIGGGTLTVLTDFVDDGQAPSGITGSSDCPNDPTTSEVDYSISPDDYLFQGSRVRPFYACVSNTESIDNRNVILYVRGNAYGRPGILTEKDFLATLSTQVLSRGILDKNPSQ